ncbi:radical SAM protein [Candidatus Falkowbacteria bacterium]|jgi:uncharacterized protein|nr:radical SAM protein [Candidatus Falkowbacteria bacterium]MBT5503666.1 radical SAM protein [Candidatus Falkowbacteria bacterium]MBT6574456.1 radical SAM protein [Candidatus Falkowbacteria bacterium]MBT7348805.1 radical SAM protein [Candidatus Falkowbacteria bacterium]MBT7501228.1 radical SAM protein [Candidatus Falkowbacteria bacterium]
MKINERAYDKIISTVVFKVTEVCNMACPHCFMFSGPDNSFNKKPPIISSAMIEKVCQRLTEYVKENKVEQLEVVLHGGEPLILGLEKLDYILTNLNKIPGVGVSMQTNGTLINDEFIELFNKHKLKVGISLDGGPDVQNKSKMKSGEDSYNNIVRGLKQLQAKADPACFRGLLCVIDSKSDPLELYDHFLQLGVKKVDFLLPLRNPHNPFGYNENKSEYFDWLKPIFEKYLAMDDPEVSIRIFDSIIDLLIGSNEPMCSIRHSGLDMLTIDTDGSIQLVDDLRICGDGFVELGLNVQKNKLVDFFDHSKVKALHQSEVNLPEQCVSCDYLNICGSGGHAFRHTGKDTYDAPSIYCRETIQLIEHIKASIYE